MKSKLAIFASVAIVLGALIASAQPKAATLSTEEWLEKLRADNRGKWNEKWFMTGQIRFLSERAVSHLSDHLEVGPDCQRAAANVGHAAAFQNLVKGGFHDMGKSVILTAKEIAEAFDPSTSVKGLLKDAAKKGAEWLIKYLQTLIAKDRAEVHITHANRDNCQLVFVSIWDKPNSRYEVIIYGDCGCNPLNSFTPRGKVKVRFFEIRMKGKAVLGPDENFENIVLTTDAPDSVKIDCETCRAGAPVTKPKPPVEKTPDTVPPPVEPLPVAEDLCEPPPSCPECKAISDKITSACGRAKEIDKEIVERIKVQLTPREERVKTAKGADLVRVEQEIKELKAAEQKLLYERTQLKVEVDLNSRRLKECIETRCKKTATGGPPKRGFDRCLVGTWTSIEATSQFNHWTNGGEGVVLNIGGDGEAAIDYGKMRPNVVGDNTRTWGGTATGQLEAASGKLSVTNKTFNVTITYIGPGQDGVARPMRMTNGLGNLLQEINAMGERNSYAYTCDPTTLVLTGLPWSSVFKRAGTRP